jgi:tetratricopeptide (TPR) repeat protein
MQIQAPSIAIQTDSLMRLAKIKYQQRDYVGAIAEFDRVLELDPYLAAAYHQRSFVYYRLENYSQALADCDRAIAYHSEFALAYANRGFIRRQIPTQSQSASSDWRLAAQLFKQQDDRTSYEKMMELVRAVKNEETWGVDTIENELIDD